MVPVLEGLVGVLLGFVGPVLELVLGLVLEELDLVGGGGGT